MRKVKAGLFASLDGVVESPEKWNSPYFDQEMGEVVGEAMVSSDAMLLGRVTYERWAAFWPAQSPEKNPNVGYMNEVRKYIVSTTLEEPLEWNNSILLESDIVEEITNLKLQPGKDISVSGSGALVHSLLQNDLLDELTLMVHPVVVGNGKRLFDNEGDHKSLKLAESKTFTTGVVFLTDQPTNRP